MGKSKVFQDGITKGQLDFTDRIDKLVLTFFPWKEPNFAPEDVLIWMTAVAGMVGTVAPILAAARIATKAGQTTMNTASNGFSSLAGAGLSQVSNEIKPE